MSTAEVVAAALAAVGVEYQERGPGQFLVTLPGTRRLRTHCWLVVREHALFVQAFVCRRPDEDHEVVYRFLLQRNARLYGVHYMLDRVGDIHFVGRGESGWSTSGSAASRSVRVVQSALHLVHASSVPVAVLGRRRLTARSLPISLKAAARDRRYVVSGWPRRR